MHATVTPSRLLLVDTPPLLSPRLLSVYKRCRYRRIVAPTQLRPQPARAGDGGAEGEGADDGDTVVALKGDRGASEAASLLQLTWAFCACDVVLLTQDSLRPRGG